MYGILCFTSKTRVQGTGIPFVEYKTNQQIIVTTKKHHLKDMWAKIHPDTHELLEILGPTCDYKTELSALRGVYGLHYKYPIEMPVPFPYTPSTQPIRAYTVDSSNTLDRDDAISVMCNSNGGVTLGIHITDLARRLPIEWFVWSKQHGSSAYWDGGSKPILPPHLSHEVLSLTKGNTYPCLSLFLTYDNGELCNVTFGSQDVYITDNFTYQDFCKNPDSTVIQNISGKKEATEIIEWCMIQYNLYMAVNLPDVLLRIQDGENEPARYAYSGTHASMSDRAYTHATSPIRRFADFYNQCAYHNLCNVLTDSEIGALNERMDEVKTFHQREILMSLAYHYKATPTIADAFVDVNEDGRLICLRIEGKRVWIPLSDTYYDEPICEALKENMVHRVEFIGIHKRGKAVLRIRLV